MDYISKNIKDTVNRTIFDIPTIIIGVIGGLGTFVVVFSNTNLGVKILDLKDLKVNIYGGLKTDYYYNQKREFGWELGSSLSVYNVNINAGYYFPTGQIKHLGNMLKLGVGYNFELN